MIVGICSLVWPGTSWGDDITELRALVAEQTELVKQQSAIVKDQSEQIRSLQDQVRELRDEAPSQIVDTIDQRIVDFENYPSSKLTISGYGTTGYASTDKGDNTFGMLFVPIFHYQLSERLHLTGEVEFDLRGDDLDVEVEYAQIDFLMNDYLTITAGKFLLPFNAFSERFHPAWINELPSLPPIYSWSVSQRRRLSGGIF